MPSPPVQSPGRHVLGSLRPPAREAYRALGSLAASGFGLGSRLRHAKILHPYGTVYRATLTLPPANGAPRGCFLAEPGEHAAIVRFSRSIGLPKRLVDLLGIGLRLPDIHGEGCHQDLLMVTSADAPVLHHVFFPSRSYLNGRVFSGSLPYRAGEDRVLVGARATSGRTQDGVDPDTELRQAAQRGGVVFDLCLSPLMGRFASIGTIRLEERLPDDENRIRFNPYNTGGGLEPISPPNVLRDWAYPGSQRGWAPTDAQNAA